MAQHQNSQASSPPVQQRTMRAISPAPAPRRRTDGWHLDKGISLSLIAALVGNGVMLIWVLGHADARLSDHERRLIHLEVASDEAGKIINSALSELRERTARIEATVGVIARDRPLQR